MGEGKREDVGDVEIKQKFVLEPPHTPCSPTPGKRHYLPKERKEI